MKLFNSAVEQRSFPSGAVHNFYIYGPVSSDINDYVDMITILDISEEHDRINIFLNTPGGALDTAISIIHAMMRSRAQIVCHADGMVASAGTLIFFAAQTYVIYPYATFMFHDGAMGIQGKINESMKNIAATSQLIERLAYDLYIPVFNEDEVVDILEGRDHYCDSQEMLERIQSAAEQNAETEQEESQPEVDTKEETADSSILAKGSRVRVNNKKLKTHGKKGSVTFIHHVGSELVEVKLDQGPSITTKRDNLESI